MHRRSALENRPVKTHPKCPNENMAIMSRTSGGKREKTSVCTAGGISCKMWGGWSVALGREEMGRRDLPLNKQCVAYV